MTTNHDRLGSGFPNAVGKSHEGYKTKGARSREKNKDLHGWIQEQLACRLPQCELSGQGMDPDSKSNVRGCCFPKAVDIAIRHDSEVIGVVNVRFVASSYRQNANNCFEQQIGETVNPRRKDIVFGHVFICVQPIPHLDKNGNIERFKSIRNSDVRRYVELAEDREFHHSPDVQALCILKLKACDTDGSQLPLSDGMNRDLLRIDLREIEEDTFNEPSGSLSIESCFRSFVESVGSKHHIGIDDRSAPSA